MNAMFWLVYTKLEANSHEEVLDKNISSKIFSSWVAFILFPCHILWIARWEKLELLTYALRSTGNLGTENQVIFLLLSFCEV